MLLCGGVRDRSGFSHLRNASCCPCPALSGFAARAIDVAAFEERARPRSNKARAKHNLPLLTTPDGTPARFEVLRPQRLVASVTVDVEQLSAHPLEADAAELYGPPDGYIDSAGRVHTERQSASDKPVHEVELRPEDGSILGSCEPLIKPVDDRELLERDEISGSEASRARQVDVAASAE
jgi:hypothetical protein